MRWAIVPNGGGEQLRSLIVEEVNRQLGPVKATVDALNLKMRSLYSNGQGGAPGFLETAREEDKKDKRELKEMIIGLVGRMDTVDDYVQEQKIIRNERERIEKLRAEEIKIELERSSTKLSKRIGKRDLLFAIATIVISLFMAWIGYKEYQRKTETKPPVVTSRQQDLPQVSGDKSITP